MFNRIEIYLIHNSFLHAELYRITHVTTTFWRNFMRYTYVSEKFNLNWYNGGIVYNTSMKMKKKFWGFFYYGITSYLPLEELWTLHIFSTLSSSYFHACGNAKSPYVLRGFFFLLCIEIWQARGASQRWNPGFFFIFVINIVLTLSYL